MAKRIPSIRGLESSLFVVVYAHIITAINMRYMPSGGEKSRYCTLLAEQVRVCRRSECQTNGTSNGHCEAGLVHGFCRTSHKGGPQKFAGRMLLKLITMTYEGRH